MSHADESKSLDLDHQSLTFFKGVGKTWVTFASISRLHIVAIAAMGTLTFTWAFTGTYRWDLMLITGLDWFLVNLLNRVVDLPEDLANAITGTDFVQKFHRQIKILGWSLLSLSWIPILLCIPEIIPFRLAYHLLGWAYNWPLLPGKKRIKALYFWKNTASAVGFMLTLFAYPMVLVYAQKMSLIPRVTPWTVLWVGVFFFLFELSYEVIYDLRDVVGDGAEGIRTYPVVHGEKVAIQIIDGLTLGALAVLILGYVLGQVPWHLAVMGAAPIIQFFLYKKALKRGITAKDCIGLTWLGAGLLAGYHIWVWLKLPGVAF